MDNTHIVVLSPKLVRDIIDADGQSPNWARPYHVVQWLDRPPTRDWLVATYRRRAHAQRRCDALRAERADAHVLDIRLYVMERTQATLEVVACMSGDTSTDTSDLRAVVAIVVANIEAAWGR